MNVGTLSKLKEYIPKLLWEQINHPPGFIVDAEEFNRRWNLNAVQGDYHAEYLSAIIEALLSIYEDVAVGIDVLDSVKNVVFFQDGFQVTYNDGMVKKWTYNKDADGFITQLNNTGDNRSIGITWSEGYINAGV